MPPIVAAAGIGAASSLIGGLINSHSAGNAANAQTSAANQALTEQKRIFDLQQAQRAPYLAQSQQALGQLGQIAGQQHAMTLPAAYTGGGMRSLGQLGQPAPASAVPMPIQAPNGPTPTPIGASDLVTVQAPTGQTAQIPRAQLQMALSRGAKQVG